MTEDLPPPALLSQVLVAFTLAIAANALRVPDEKGGRVRGQLAPFGLCLSG